MSSPTLITDPESIRANQNGQITHDQSQSLQSRLGTLPGCLTLAILGALLVGVAVVGQKIFAQSTPLAIAALVVVILATFAISAFLGGLLGRLRMRSVSVERLPGQVTFKNGRYLPVSGSRALEAIDNSSSLLPGEYTFYLMRGTRYLLSAQAAGTAGANAGAAPAGVSLKDLLDQPVDFDPHLEPARAAERLVALQHAAQAAEAAGAFSPTGINQQEAADLYHRAVEQVKQLVPQAVSLTAAASGWHDLLNLAHQVQQAESEAEPKPKLDAQGLAQLTHALDQAGVRHPASLPANSAGQQTGPQRTELTKDIASNLLWSAGVGVGWLALAYTAITRANWQALLAVSVFALLILAILLSGTRKELADLLSGRVQVEEGWVTKFTRDSHSSGRSSTIHYYYQVNQRELAVSQYAYNALIEGNYRVYFLGQTGRLVNIEVMQEFSS